MDVQAVSTQGRPTAAPSGVVAANDVPASGASSKAAQRATDRAVLTSTIAKLFGHDEAPKHENLEVSYQVDRHPYDVVTVFTDPATGQEVAQFPAEVLVSLAEFFDHSQGVTLDKNA